MTSQYPDPSYIILARGPWRPADVITSYLPPSKSTPEIIAAAKRQREPALIAAAQRSSGHFFNGHVYGLQKFSKYKDDAGRSRLLLDFTSSNYFDMLCIDNALDDSLEWRGRITTLRQELFGPHRQHVALSPHLVNCFGFGGLIVTSDNFAILTRRASNLAVYSGHYTSSVAEGAAFPEDSANGGGVDLLRMVSRGMKEELALDIRDPDVTFISLGMDPKNCSCFLVTLINVSLTKREIQDQLRRNAPADGWEREELYFVSWDPESITDFMNNHTPWVSVTILEALRHSFG